MTLKEMEYVVTVAKYKSFSKAAETLFVSQSALSQSITRLEKELGLRLFRRTNKDVSLTFAGDTFVNKSKELLKLEEKLTDEMKNLASCKKRFIRVGIHQYYGKYFIPKIMPLYKKMLPDVQIKLVEDYSANLENLILEDKLDVVISSFQEKNPKLGYKNFYTEDLLLAVSKCNPVNPNSNSDTPIEEVDLNLFKDENFILLIKDARYRKTIDKICDDINFKPNCILESKDFETINSLINQGMGIGFVHSSIVREKNTDYYKIKNINESRKFYIAYNITTPYRPYIVAEFIKLAENAMKE